MVGCFGKKLGGDVNGKVEVKVDNSISRCKGKT